MKKNYFKPETEITAVNAVWTLCSNSPTIAGGSGASGQGNPGGNTGGTGSPLD